MILFPVSLCVHENARLCSVLSPLLKLDRAVGVKERVTGLAATGVIVDVEVRRSIGVLLTVKAFAA
jgi:hypothetical protein